MRTRSAHRERVVSVGIRLTRRVAPPALALLLVAAAGTHSVAQQQRAPLSGAELYRAACANCHGVDGKGAEPALVGFPEELPDFTDCTFASREPAADWAAVVHQGGPVRAFSRRMPAFGKALTPEEIARVVAHVIGLCTDRSWPRGELNLPRTLNTEKAFPEDETVLEFSASSRRGERAYLSTLIYERRIGSQTQWELVVPFGVREQVGAPGRWTGMELGDVAVALKRALAHSGERGYIVSAGTEAILPTGNRTRGFGKGTPVFEPFIAAAKLFPRDAFVQMHTGLELPFNARKAEREAFGRVGVGATFGPEFGRVFTPMVELLASRELESGARTTADWAPQIQISLSKRQHILANIGARLPITDRHQRGAQFQFYLLWDWFDGGFFDGWR